MHLLQLKIRGLGDLPETDWLETGRRLTVISSANRHRTELIRCAVEALNPSTPCRETKPFKKLPLETTTRNGYRKTVDPAKRTIIFGIYDSPSSLVHELGNISADLYETDRIEVGRRLDYSRWINFVELASSTRWNEVSEEFNQLLAALEESRNSGVEIASLIDSLSETDRIKAETAATLAAWLRTVKSQLPDRDITETLAKVERWKKFKAARSLVEKRLPLMIPVTASAQPAAKLEKVIEDAGDSERMIPILLVDLFEENSAAMVDKKLQSLDSLSGDRQSIVFLNMSCSVSNLPDEIPHHYLESITRND